MNKAMTMNEKVYTETEIKAWFNQMRKIYKNCPLCEHLIQAEDLMFEPRFEKESLENFKKSLDNSDKV